MTKRIVKKIVKRVLRKEGIVLCAMCDDAVATHTQDMCAECYDVYVDMQMEDAIANMREACR